VLSLHVMDGVIPISRICQVFASTPPLFPIFTCIVFQCLQITAPRLNALVRECGCTVTKTTESSGSGEVTHVGHASLPLKFPEGKRGRK
jgi:hypothetical protein